MGNEISQQTAFVRIPTKLRKLRQELLKGLALSLPALMILGKF